MELPASQDIGARLLAGRKRAELSQMQLAARLACDQKQVSRWEQGAVSPTAVQLIAICAVLGLDPAEVLAPLAA